MDNFNIDSKNLSFKLDHYHSHNPQIVIWTHKCIHVLYQWMQFFGRNGRMNVSLY
jgi:hypothetical protein